MAFLSSLYKALRITILNRKWKLEIDEVFLGKLKDWTTLFASSVCGSFLCCFYSFPLCSCSPQFIACDGTLEAAARKAFFSSPLVVEGKIDWWSESEWKIMTNT